MASTNQHLLAQSDAITANADEVQALYGLQYLDAAKRAKEFLETVGGSQAPSQERIDAINRDLAAQPGRWMK